MRILGLDPGLRVTGWGLLEATPGRLRHVANGSVRPRTDGSLAARLAELDDGLAGVIETFAPHVAAVEETFVNRNPASALKLGHARGVVLLAPARAGLAVHEYAATQIKKSVVGVGHAGKDQIGLMVRVLLPGCAIDGADAADALAVAICHAHHAETEARFAAAGETGEARARLAAGR
jgi:crossover junction endodeoxyribonuclease RuvC